MNAPLSRDDQNERSSLLVDLMKLMGTLSFAAIVLTSGVLTRLAGYEGGKTSFLLMGLFYFFSILCVIVSFGLAYRRIGTHSTQRDYLGLQMLCCIFSVIGFLGALVVLFYLVYPNILVVN